MQADHHNHNLLEIRDVCRGLNPQSPAPSAGGSCPDSSMWKCPEETREGIGAAGGIERVGAQTGSPGVETNGLAGEFHDGLSAGIRNRHGLMTKSKAKTKQVRLRLPKAFAEFLDAQPNGVRGALFMAVVFGQIPTTRKPVEYIQAAQCLQRLAVLLMYALERELEEPLAADAERAIGMINKLTSKRRGDPSHARLRMPVEYADFLPASISQREFLMHLAVQASAMSIPLPMLVLVVPILDELRIRLMDMLRLSPDTKPEEEVRKVVYAVLGLTESGWKGVVK